MEKSLEIYETQLQLITEACADPWFGEQLALARVGDGQARRRICGSCLRMVFEIAKRRWRPDSLLSLLEFVEEGNAILMKTIKRFHGAKASGFLQQVKENVESWYTILLEHPSWARARRDSWR